MTDTVRFNPDALALLRRAGGDKLLQKMTQMFIASAPDRLIRVEKNIAAGHFVDAERDAHSLKGSAGQLGAMSLYDRCDLLEKAIAARDEAGAIAELAQARMELANAINWLGTNTQTQSGTLKPE